VREVLKKILIIENNAATRCLFSGSLTAKGFSTIEAENGVVGIQQAQTELPDVIISNIAMPEMNGYEMLTQLRQDLQTAGIPLIFVTDKTHREDIRRAMELGADDYLTKPYTIEELLNAIAACLEKRALLQQWYTMEIPDALANSLIPTKETISQIDG
jgi:CheY-like chemotaxis protein